MTNILNTSKLKQTADTVLLNAVQVGHIPGVVASVSSGNDTLYEAAFGERALGQGVAMTPDTVFWLASMTKPIVGAAAMQLVEQGKLTLDEPAAKILPELAEVKLLTGWDAAGKPLLRSPTTQITLRQLLTHTAGFTSDIWNADSARYLKTMNLPRAGSGKKIALSVPLTFEPGTRWEYGINIDWAGQLVAAASGMRLGEYLQKNITGPLGMSSTGFRISANMRARLATVHQRDPVTGALNTTPFEVPQETEFDPGGGGMYSTAGDYLRFSRMILNQGRGNGQQLLKPETLALMSKNAMGPLRVNFLRTQNPAASLDTEFFPGIEKTWGLTFMINEQQAPTGRSAGSLAWAGLPNAFFWIDPTKDLAGVILMQVLPFVDPRALGLFTDYETAVYAAYT
ncbi:MAG: 1,4-butanediol diacrylate esterase [Alcaligenaceae bacterium]|nr:MAG: 1,4-butanediol diacrylate esterase [Alcaligenaceae bacterium]